MLARHRVLLVSVVPLSPNEFKLVVLCSQPSVNIALN